jgi:hypothetical protein
VSGLIIIIVVAVVGFGFIGWAVYANSRDFHKILNEYKEAVEQEAREIARERQESIR